MPVLLFDIDGTLLDGHGVGRRALEASLSTTLGQPVDTSGISFSGKTDPQIVREILSSTALAGSVPADLEHAISTTLSAYQTDMAVRLAVDPVSALPGVADLVRRLHAAAVPLGLLTGNLHPLAYQKVGRIGLDAALFPFGAFGSDHEDRNALPAVAAARAAAHLRREVPLDDLVIIGDTPRDIACARAVGARVVAVATGRFAAADLADADLVLDSLDGADLAAFL
jgi:phosphoglycolate phosphatase-like HAD superfamily hydrolase